MRENKDRDTVESTPSFNLTIKPLLLYSIEENSWIEEPIHITPFETRLYPQSLNPKRECTVVHKC